MFASRSESAFNSVPSASGEPVAIIGMACRFPGANDIEAFWRLLEAGGNAVTEGVPGSGVGRWGQLFGENAVQSEGCRFGAFVDDIDQFDDAFFRISPVEAELLDPQQRMMLEVSWRALEDAGIDPDRLRESRTGVYTGISNDEYRMLVVESAKPAEAAACLYALSGTNLNGTAGRVSFVLGLRGPAKAVDAACASAMVAINDAVADLQQGKANLAHRGRRAGHPQRAHLRTARGRDDALARRAVQDLRCLGERVRARRGLRGRGAEAPERRGGGRGPHLGGDPELRGEPRRDRRRAYGAEHSGAGAGDGGRAVSGGARPARGGLRRGARHRNGGGRTRSS